MSAFRYPFDGTVPPAKTAQEYISAADEGLFPLSFMDTGCWAACLPSARVLVSCDTLTGGDIHATVYRSEDETLENYEALKRIHGDPRIMAMLRRAR